MLSENPAVRFPACPPATDACDRYRMGLYDPISGQTIMVSDETLDDFDELVAAAANWYQATAGDIKRWTVPFGGKCWQMADPLCICCEPQPGCCRAKIAQAIAGSDGE